MQIRIDKHTNDVIQFLLFRFFIIFIFSFYMLFHKKYLTGYGLNNEWFEIRQWKGFF